MDKIIYKPFGVCSRQILVELDGDIIKRVEFVGGCMGNTQGIARLVEGMNVQEVLVNVLTLVVVTKGCARIPYIHVERKEIQKI